MAAAPASTSAAPAPDREEIVFLDVETSTPPCVLLEFGAVVVCSRRLVDVSSYATLVRPANLDAVPDPTARRNGITRGTLADAPPFKDVADKVYGVLHGRVWAGHNIVDFDSVIIRDAFVEIGRPPPQPKGMVDTLPLLTQWFGPRAGDMKLASLANYFGLGKQRHRSLDDVKMNIDVLKNCATVLFLFNRRQRRRSTRRAISTARPSPPPPGRPLHRPAVSTAARPSPPPGRPKAPPPGQSRRRPAISALPAIPAVPYAAWPSPPPPGRPHRPAGQSRRRPAISALPAIPVVPGPHCSAHR